MTATDELRKLLTERGVEWVASGTDTCWTSADGYPMRAWDTTNGTHMRVADLTPEQVIATTLGSERETELQKALNKAAGNWAMADAELRKALDFMRIWISEDAHLGESAISRELEKAEGLRNLDAIESAIAATLGHSLNNPSMSETLSERGTCKNKATSSRTFWCDCCDCALEDWMDVGGKLVNGLRYCPNCGRKVEG